MIHPDEYAIRGEFFSRVWHWHEAQKHPQDFHWCKERLCRDAWIVINPLVIAGLAAQGEKTEQAE